jgi:hypothetical protein
MRSIGISDDLIVKFTDPDFWLDYFPPHCKVRIIYIILISNSNLLRNEKFKFLHCNN